MLLKKEYRVYPSLASLTQVGKSFKVGLAN